MEEVGVDDIYHPGSVLDIPKRPPWDYSMTKEQVERQEEAMFSRYLHNIHSKYQKEDLSYFEHNLEVVQWHTHAHTHWQEDLEPFVTESFGFTVWLA